MTGSQNSRWSHAAERHYLAIQPRLSSNRRERQREYGFGPITTMPAEVFTGSTLTSDLSGAPYRLSAEIEHGVIPQSLFEWACVPDPYLIPQ
jgi:hypothetical protein